MVCRCGEPVQDKTIDNTNKKRKSYSKEHKQPSIKITFDGANCCPLLKKRIRKLGVNKVTQEYLWKARMPNRVKSYDLQERKWMTYCLQRGIDCENPDKKNVLEFLSNVAVKGLTYLSVNSARSAM